MASDPPPLKMEAPAPTGIGTGAKYFSDEVRESYISPAAAATGNSFTKREAREVLIFLDRVGVWERLAMTLPGMIEAATIGLICEVADYLTPEAREQIALSLLGQSLGSEVRHG